MNKKQVKYKKLTDFLISKIRDCRIPKYSSRFSKKIYSLWQHIVLHCFRQMLNLSYREFTDWLEASKLIEYLKLKRIPHFTTLQKVVKRLKPLWLQVIITSFIKNIKLKVGIDATGFSIREGSSYYCKRTAIVTKKKRYIKLSVLADLANQLVIACAVRMFPANDYKDFLPLVKKVKGRDIEYIAADKAYDSNENHRFIFRELNARSRIKSRDYGKRSCNRRTFYIRKAMREFDEREYHQRSKVEAIFFVIKQITKSVVRSMKFYTRKAELLFKVVIYNARRVLNFFVILRFST
jgi:hypothetical protein